MAFAPGSLSDDAAAWKGQSLVGVQQLDEAGLNLVLAHAERLRGQPRDKVLARQRGKILANVFYEPSTRTMCSFDAAMKRLGGDVLSVSESSSSAKKGETIEDTVRCLQCYCDVLVLRHPQVGTAAKAAAAAQKPVLNAGDGVGEHPTQALLDLFTIIDTRAKAAAGTGLLDLSGLTLTMLGDLKHGRTVHSLALLAARLAKPPRLALVAPASLAMPAEVTTSLTAAGVQLEQADGLSGVLPTTDVLYVTRVQKERFASEKEYEAVRGAYVVDAKLMTQAYLALALT